MKPNSPFRSRIDYSSAPNSSPPPQPLANLLQRQTSSNFASLNNGEWIPNRFTVVTENENADSKGISSAVPSNDTPAPSKPQTPTHTQVILPAAQLSTPSASPSSSSGEAATVTSPSSSFAAESKKKPSLATSERCRELLLDTRLWVTLFSAIVNFAVVILLVIIVNPYKSELSQVQQHIEDLQSTVVLMNAVQQIANYSQIQGAATIIQNQVQSVSAQSTLLNFELSSALSSFSSLNSSVQLLNKAVFSGAVAVNGTIGTCNNKIGNDFGPYGEYGGPSTFGDPLITVTGSNRTSLLQIPPVTIYNPQIELSGLCNISTPVGGQYAPPYYLSLWDQRQGLLLSHTFDGVIGVQTLSLNGSARGLWNFTSASAIWFSCLNVNCLIFDCAPICLRIFY